MKLDSISNLNLPIVGWLDTAHYLLTSDIRDIQKNEKLTYDLRAQPSAILQEEEENWREGGGGEKDLMGRRRL